MKSFSLIRTNVALTTNSKIIVTGNYNLSLDSIESDPALSADKYKGFKFRKDNWYDEVLPKFFEGLPPSIGFKVKDNDDKDLMFNTFENQYDDIYQSGCKNISNNKSYDEEFECFAPLYLGKELPTNFIIFRVDGPGIVNLNRENFREEILDKLKVVTIFNLTTATPLGEWLDQNFIKNEYNSDYPLYIDFRRLEFSSWRGIDYEVGGFTERNVFLDSTLEWENTFFDLEKLITDGFRENKVVFPNILNLSFLFDDTPATPDTLRKWSLNRYMGFYLDSLNKVYSYTPYTLKPLRLDVVIKPGNILTSSNFDNPFETEWSDTDTTFVEIDGNYLKVERYFRETSPTETKIELSTGVFSDEVVRGRKYFWKVLSIDELAGLTYSGINSNNVKILNDANGWYLERSNGSDLIPSSDTADVWIIKIHEKWHKLKKTNSKWYLNTDYGFELSDNILKYWINRTDTNNIVQINLNPQDPTVSFEIYRLDFTEVKDFDTSIVDTMFSRYEYEKELTLSKTEQPKIYASDLSSNVNPAPYNEYIVENNITNVPCSSEYTANGELFRIENNQLTKLWNKNPVRLKWSFDSSISANDMPYPLNNSLIADDFNMTTQVFNLTPARWDRNLDYFYSINSATNSSFFHSLHIENYLPNGDIDKTFKFDLLQYLDVNRDYFSWFFGKNIQFSSGSLIAPTNKWSYFQKGTSVTPNTTLFRGIKFDIFNILDLKVTDRIISNINFTTRNEFEGWKFSILLSKNNYKVVASASNTNVGITQSTSSQLSWTRIDEWQYSKQYPLGQLAIYQNIIWQSNSNHITTNPALNPANSSDWILHSTQSSTLSASYSVFWHPEKSYQPNDWIYYAGNYYYNDPLGTTYSFWNPRKTYDIDDFVIYNTSIYRSIAPNNFFQPESTSLVSDFTNNENPYYWEEWSISNPTDWKIIEVWSSGRIYSTSSVQISDEVRYYPGTPYVVWEETLFKFIGITPSTEEPSNTQIWQRLYSFKPDTDFIYSGVTNSIIKMNNTYYVCLSNPNSDTLENGICVYINKKWKNILINIFVNDNTLDNIQNSDRDALYSQIYANLTAGNLILALSDLTNKYGFSDYTKYVIIDESGSINVWDFNSITTLPIILVPQLPDYLQVRNFSLKKTAISLNENQLKPKRVLEQRKIETIDMLNYYNGNKFATIIDKDTSEVELLANYSGIENNIYNLLWRFSGNYTPMFYKIPLFKTELNTALNIGNYKFDTSLTEFGMMKERILSKVNRANNVLKLRNNPDLKSIYPMVDEFGLTIAPFFIFKSTWDTEFYKECLELTQNDIPVLLTNKIVKFE